jgi:hypothetical protein
MKRLLIALFSTALMACCQGTAFYTWNIQVSPVDSAVPVTTSLDGAVAEANIILKSTAGLAPLTLSANCAAAATSCTFASTAGVVVGNGICFASPCNIVASATGGPPPTTFTLSAGEIALVTGPCAATCAPGVAVNSAALNLKRGSIGTAVAGTSGQLVTAMNAGSYSQWAANFWAASLAPIIQNSTYGAYTAVTAQTAISTAQATAQASIAAAEATLQSAH